MELYSTCWRNRICHKGFSVVFGEEGGGVSEVKLSFH